MSANGNGSASNSGLASAARKPGHAMKPGFMVTMVECKNCKLAWQVNQVVVNRALVPQFAHIIHEQQRVIDKTLCTLPALVVGFIECFYSAEALEQNPLVKP